MGKERTVAQIVIFGGTNEGRRLAEAFAGTPLTLHVCVATEYGAELTPEAKNIHIHEGRLNEAEMEDFLPDFLRTAAWMPRIHMPVR